jgi:hypothetical protein
MKVVIIILAIIVLSIAPASADSFLEDFNLYAESLYNIQTLEPIIVEVSYKSADVEIMKTDEITIYGQDALSVISAACCALRTIDNASSMIDQYGRIMNAYFMNQTQRTETRATTEAGVLIYFSEDNGIFEIRLVK